MRLSSFDVIIVVADQGQTLSLFDTDQQMKWTESLQVIKQMFLRKDARDNPSID